MASHTAQCAERRFEGRQKVEVRARGESKRIAGHAAVFYDGTAATEYELWRYGNERMVERLLPTAFDRALREQDDVRALFNHEPALILGRTAAGTLALATDAVGLAYEIDPPDTQLARDLLASVARGDVSGSSFAFRVEEQVFREQKLADGQLLVVREIVSVRLYDVGPVTYPAYDATTAGLRSAGAGSDQEEIRTALDEWRRQRGLPARLAGYRARAVEVE